MATSAFKSTSRRETTTDNPPKKKPIRRSHSVSSLSRTTAQSDIAISEFLNKRDNPLFCTTNTAASTCQPEDASSERGRPASKSSGDDVARRRAEVGPRRRRSVSRSPYGASQSSTERDHVTSSSYRKKNVNIHANIMKKSIVNDNAADVHRAAVRMQFIEPSANSVCYSEGPNWEDTTSSGSLTEAEEKTIIEAFYEQVKGDYVDEALSPSNGIYETVRSEVRRAILDIHSDLESGVQRNNTHALGATNVADIPPDLVNSGAIELVSDIRKEYAKKLEESQERATKLRADLAVEDHRGQEFSKILKEIIPDPKTNNMQKSRSGRKRSNERKNMSKRLTEEAMAYFDECVSISTFDSSDFSAPEDSPFNFIEANIPVGPTTSFRQDSSSFSNTNCGNDSHNHNQDIYMDSGSTASSSRNEPVMIKELGRKSRFSFSQRKTENGELQRGISSYIKNIGKEYVGSTINLDTSRRNYDDMDLYMHDSRESLLLEMVLSKNRIECGSLHLCGGGLANFFPPFTTII